jgi:hypothetical protein
LFSLTAIQLYAQKNKSSNSSTPHFIEGIELSRNENKATSIIIKDEETNPIQTKQKIEIIKDDEIEQLSQLQIKYEQFRFF